MTEQLSLGLPWQLIWYRIHLQCRRPQFNSWFGKIHWRRNRLPTPVFLGFPCGSAGKESACNATDLGLISGLGRSPGEGKGFALQYSGLENSMDCRVYGFTELDTTEWLSISKNFETITPLVVLLKSSVLFWVLTPYISSPFFFLEIYRLFSLSSEIGRASCRERVLVTV